MRSLLDAGNKDLLQISILKSRAAKVKGRIGRLIIRRANVKRNTARWRQAASLYRIALIFAPYRHDVAIQAGNCFKEAGQYDLAIRHYDRAIGTAHGPEALLQKGDALARAGAETEAIKALEEAVALKHPKALARLVELGECEPLEATDRSAIVRLNQPFAERFLLNRLTRAGRTDRRWLGSLDRTTHERIWGEGLFSRDSVAFIQVGWLKIRNKGRNEALLTGIVAVRARIVASERPKSLELLADEQVVAQGAPVEVHAHPSGRRLYSVNIWLDTAALKVGRKALILRVVNGDGSQQTIRTIVNVLRTPKDLELEDSDAFVHSAARPLLGDASSEVAARPAVVRAAARRLISTPIRDILAMRVDQLGDLSASLPALRRLRALFPQARITAMVAPAFIEVIKATGVCDEVLPFQLAYDHKTERRYLESREEKRVQEELSRRRFDLAIDLCPGEETRPLLKMADASFLVGFHPREFDFLDFGIDVISRDKVNRIAKIPHAASVLMLIDSLASAMTPERPPAPRLKDDRAALAQYGLKPRGYLLIHTGARHALNQWSIDRYIALANQFALEVGAPVVFFTDNPIDDRQREALRASDGVILLHKTPMDVFDALISNAAVVVGNDSGPKHLAAARGVQTVSLHVNRLNWSEWGQDSRGAIITKRVPCSGCGLNDVQMCAKDVLCLTSIRVEEVFPVVLEKWHEAAAAAREKPSPSRRRA